MHVGAQRPRLDRCSANTLALGLSFPRPLVPCPLGRSVGFEASRKSPVPPRYAPVMDQKPGASQLTSPAPARLASSCDTLASPRRPIRTLGGYRDASRALALAGKGKEARIPDLVGVPQWRLEGKTKVRTSAHRHHHHRYRGDERVRVGATTSQACCCAKVEASRETRVLRGRRDGQMADGAMKDAILMARTLT
ncbi:hypothetical protein OH77DRAFT_1074795 [Trametes cingulata]|nr:hypothetical protein OH77DRAFT_1074795 [Trametes cingulata]